MTTNVPSISIIKGLWNTPTIEANAYTAITYPGLYSILWLPDTSKNIIIEENKVESEEKLRQIFSEFAEEDMNLAELGLAEYNDILLTEDKE